MGTCEHPDVKRFGDQSLTFNDLVVLGEPALAPLRNTGVHLDLVTVASGRTEVTARGYDGRAQDAVSFDGFPPGRNTAVSKEVQRPGVKPAEKIGMENNPAGITVTELHGDFKNMFQAGAPWFKSRKDTAGVTNFRTPLALAASLGNDHGWAR